MKLGNTRISRNVNSTTFSHYRNKDIKITAESLFVLLLGETKQFMLLYLFTHIPIIDSRELALKLLKLTKVTNFWKIYFLPLYITYLYT